GDGRPEDGRSGRTDPDGVEVPSASLIYVRADPQPWGWPNAYDRFPQDFLFQLTRAEFEHLKSQSVTSSHGGIRRAMPYAFTEQGVAMLSSVLNSPRAIQVNIAIMRAFVKMREAALAHKDLLRKLTAMEKKYDSQFQVVFTAIKNLMEPLPVKPKKRIGFRAPAATTAD
ncbi:MAG: ORF6N domain-containing protein, partial [Bryobacteraceae bacterium]